MKNKFNLTKTFNLNINNCILLNLFILFVVILNRKNYFVNGLKCICNRSECDIIRSEDCPGKGIIVWDPCKCCKVCAKTLGEACGGPGGFSGKCEPPLYCISKPPIIGNGICLELPTNSSKVKCDEKLQIDSGCEIVNRKCQCWGRTTICKNSLRLRYDFKNMKECQLNLQNLVKSELEFDEDYTIPPASLAYQKPRGRRRNQPQPPAVVVQVSRGGNSAYALSNERTVVKCIDFECPKIENEKIKCPDDSQPEIIYPDSHHTIFWQSSPSDNAFSNSHNPKRFPRFATKSRTPREIEQQLIKLCCPHYVCQCKACPVPECNEEKNFTAILTVQSSNQPGQCCPKYECKTKPDCHAQENGYTWFEPCVRCECNENEFICHETCVGDQEPSAACIEGTKMFMDGEHWKRDACTDCQCNNGVPQCKVSMCPQLQCHRTVQRQNVCCPVCDKSNSTFCPGHEDCGIACKHDYLKSNDGCTLCECAPFKTHNKTTSTSTTTTTTEISIIVHVDDRSSENDSVMRHKPWYYNSSYWIFSIIFVAIIIILVIIVFLCWKRNQKCHSDEFPNYARVLTTNSSDNGSVEIRK